MTVIDAHQHVWDPGRVDYPWLGPALAPINRRFDLAEAMPAMRRAGVEATVLVQAADSAAETAYLLSVADQHPGLVAGVVGWVPLDDPETAAAMLAGRDPRIVGIRDLIHDRPDPDWIIGPRPDAGLGVLAEAGLPFDYVTSGPAALAHLPGIGARHPGLRLVIDHLGKPPLGGGPADRARWRALLAAAAENPLTHAKISGLYADTATVRPFVDDALELFGPGRLMIGSDWPISVLHGGDYDQIWNVSAADEAIRGGTAAAFYRLQ